MATTITKLFRTGILQSSVEFDEITHSIVKIATDGVYASEFDEVEMQTPGAPAERKTRDGKLLVSGFFDEYSISSPELIITAIIPSSLANPEINQPYSISFTASGGTSPYIFEAVLGTLPSGISLSSLGVLSGTPIEQGTFDFTIKVTDAIGNTRQQSYQVTIDPLIEITPSSLSPLISGQEYSAILSATGGTAPYTYEIESGTLPENVTLNTDGTITGVTYLDNLTITPSSLNDAINNSSYTATLTVLDGTAPYTYTLDSGTLPTGLILNTDGTITGIPTI